MNEQKHICENPKECKRKREKWEECQEKFLPIGQQELEVFVEKLQKGEAYVRYDEHFVKRSRERCFSDSDVSEVLSYGWAIERNKNIKGISLVVLGYIGKNYRPVHVVFDVLDENMWVAVTAYDPRTHSWKWNDNFDGRVCFCNFENE